MKDINWNNIATYINGEANESLKREIEARMKNDEKYESEIKELANQMAMVENINKMKEFNTDNAFNNLKQRLEVNGLVPKQHHRKTIPLFVKIAAMVVIMISMGIVAWVQFGGMPGPSNYASFYAKDLNETKEVLLPDGTKVFLNYKSKIVLPDAFNNQTRVVNLFGEAYFDVARDTTKPFIINVENARIEVLGTSFNVKNNAGKKQVEVLVETGKVNLSDVDEKTRNVTLTQGDFGVLQKENIYTSGHTNENYLSWKTRKLVFKSTSIEEVAQVIEETYHMDFEINDKIKKCALTSTFNNKSLPEVLKTLEQTLGINFEIKNKKVILSGDGC